MPLSTKTRAATILALVMAILLCGPVVVNAQTHKQDQWVTTSSKDISLADLFKSIKKQTGFTIFYSNSVLDDSEKIKFSSGKIRLDDLLMEIFNPKKIAWVYKDQLIILQKKNNVGYTRSSVNGYFLLLITYIRYYQCASCVFQF